MGSFENKKSRIPIEGSHVALRNACFQLQAIGTPLAIFLQKKDRKEDQHQTCDYHETSDGESSFQRYRNTQNQADSPHNSTKVEHRQRKMPEFHLRLLIERKGVFRRRQFRLLHDSFQLTAKSLRVNEEQVQQTNERDVTDTSEIPLKSFMDIATNLASNREVIERTILRVWV